MVISLPLLPPVYIPQYRNSPRLSNSLTINDPLTTTEKVRQSTIPGQKLFELAFFNNTALIQDHNV